MYHRRNPLISNLIIASTVFLKLTFTEAHADDEITALPGLYEKPKFKQYSGYLDASSERFLNYWFIESQNDPENDPLILWLPGGPGCSATLSIFNGVGPFYINKDGKTLTNNAFSWNLISNIIFLESPVGVGYSYSLDQKYETDDDTVSMDNYQALQHFFLKFPQFKNNDFYIAGISYAGTYIPTLSVRVLADSSINFKGILIGGGLFNFGMNMNTQPFFAYSHGLIGNKQWKKMTEYCCESCQMETCNFNNSASSEACNNTFNIFSNSIKEINNYNIHSDCENLDSETKPEIKKMSNSNSKIPCMDNSNLSFYMNMKEVRQALHVPEDLPEWGACNGNVRSPYKFLYKSMKPQILELINSKRIRGLIFNGDLDMACNFIGNEWFVDDLGLEAVSDYKPWKFNGQVAGFVKTFTNLTYTNLKGAGHVAIKEKPDLVFHMFSGFLKNEPL